MTAIAAPSTTSHGQGLPRHLVAFFVFNLLATLAKPCIRFGVSWYVLQKTGSTALFVALLGLSTMVDAVSRPLLAPLADYFDRLGVYRLCAAGAMVLTLVLTAAVSWLPFNAWLLGGLLLSLALTTGLREPTASALLAQSPRPEHQARLQSAILFGQSLVLTVGPALAGLLVMLAGPTTALLGAAALEGVALLGVLRLTAPPQAVDPAPLEARSWSTFTSSWRDRVSEGLRCLWLTKVELRTVAAWACQNVAVLAFVAVVLPVWVARDLKASADSMALIEVSLGVGLLLGSSLVASLMNRCFGRWAAMVVGPALAAAAFIGAAHAGQSVWLAAGLIGAAAATMAVGIVNASTVRALATPDSHRARMSAACGFAVNAGLPVAMGLFGWLLDRYPASVSLLVCGGLFAIAAAVMGGHRQLRLLLSKSPAELTAIYERLHPAAFHTVDRSGPTGAPRG